MNKILIFNGYYYPSKNCGGPITSIENIVNTCCDEFTFYIICYNHDFNDRTVFNVDLNCWIKVGNANVMYVEHGYLDFSTKRMKQLLLSIKPDLIWFSGILTPNNKLVTARIAKKYGFPVLFSPRGELSADRVKIKGYKKIPYLKIVSFLGLYKKCYFHGTSDDEEAGIIKFFNPDENHYFRAANISIAQQPELVDVEKTQGELKVFFFSRIHEVKNLLFGVQCLCKCRNNILLDVYGPIESENYWNNCLEVAKNAPSNIKMNYGGILDYSNKSIVIQQHHCFLFPTLNENYGHVIAESLANSRPVILSKGTTPWDDMDKRAGFVIDLSNAEGFTNALDCIAEMDQDEYSKFVASTKKYFLDKTADDDAVSKHKMMFRSIIDNYS